MMSPLKIIDSETKGDLEFLLSFAPATDVNQLVPGLMAMFYLTGTYEGDYEIISRVESIVKRYNLDVDVETDTED